MCLDLLRVCILVHSHGSDVFATINVLCTHDHSLQSNSWMASGKNARILKVVTMRQSVDRMDAILQWMTRRSSAQHQCSQSSCCPFQSLESAESKREEPAVLSSSCKLSQAAASAFSLSFHYSRAASPPHIPLPRQEFDLFIYVCFSLPFETLAKTSKSMKKKMLEFWTHLAMCAASNISLLSWLKCPASRACASNAAFLERQLHATKTGCPTTSCSHFHCNISFLNRFHSCVAHHWNLHVKTGQRAMPCSNQIPSQSETCAKRLRNGCHFNAV